MGYFGCENMSALNPNMGFIQILNGFQKWEQNVSHLLMQNKDLFKLLFYDDFDPLSHDITDEQIADMMTEYTEINERNPNCKVFFRKFTNDVEMEQGSQIRIYPIRVRPSDIYIGDMQFRIDAITHMGIDKIKNENRRHRMASEILQSLNGQEIKMVKDVRIVEMYMWENQYIRQFDGWSLIFATGVSAIG